MHCPTSVGKARSGSFGDFLEIERCRGPGMRLCDARVGEEARLVGRDRAGVPGIDCYVSCRKLGEYEEGG